MKKLKNQLSLFLSVLMIISAMPFSAFAEDALKTDASGSNSLCTWEYTAETDTLYINGTTIECGLAANKTNDKLPTYTENEDGSFGELWDNKFSHLVFGKDVETINDCDLLYTDPVSITFEEGSKLKKLSSYAFANTNRITSIELPQTLEYIGSYCFIDSYIESIVIPDSVSYIGSCAFKDSKIVNAKLPDNPDLNINSSTFYNCDFLETVDLGNSITSIPNNMFRQCYSLKNIVMPDTVESIGRYAFSFCESLENVTFSDNLVDIADYAFYSCILLTKLSLPDTLYCIGNDAFSDCESLTDVEFGNELSSIGSFAFSGDAALTSAVIPNTIEEISTGAFRGCSSLSEVVIGDNPNYQQISIGSDAFYATAISSITIPASVDSIGSYAFGCTENLTDVVFETREGPYGTVGLDTIGKYAFSNSAIQNIVLPSTVSQLSDGAFKESQLISADLSQTDLTDLAIDLFSGCTKLTDVKLPKNLSHVYENVFLNCTNLKKVDFGESLENIPDAMFEGCINLTDIILPENLKTIGDKAFNNCKALDISIPSTVTSIGDYAFSNTNLTSVKIPAYLATIGNYTFSDCTNLSVAEFSGNESLKSIGTYAFLNTHIENIDIPDSCTTISEGAFRNCKYLQQVELPKNVTAIGTNAFLNVPVKEIVIQKSNVSMSSCGLFAYTDENGTVVYNTEGTIKGKFGSTAETYAKNHSINFVAYTEIDGTEIPLTTSGTWQGGTWEYALTKNYATNTTYRTLNINGNGDITSTKFTMSNGIPIDVALLVDTFGVQKVDIAVGVTSIPDNFLYGSGIDNSQVTLVNIPYGTTSIGENAFRGCSIGSIFIPNSVTYVGDYAFADNKEISEIVLSNKLSEINRYVFANDKFAANCTKKITIPDSVKVINEGAFANFSSIKTINIPISVTDIYYSDEAPQTNPIGFLSDGSKAAYTISVRINSAGYDYVNKAGLSYDYGNGKQNENGYFYVANGTKKWEYNEETKTVTLEGIGKLNGDYFYYSDGNKVRSGDFEVEKVIIGDEITDIVGDIKTSVFAVLNPKYIELPETIKTINQYAFNDCTNLQSIVLPDSVISIEPQAFKNCISLKSVKFGSGLAEIPSEIFKNFKSLKFVDFGSGITKIGDSAFQNCTELQQINIPDNVTYIGRYAFYKCVNVQSVTIGSGVETLAQNAFGDLALCETVNINNKNFNAAMSDSEVSKYDMFKRLGASTTGVTLVLGDNVTTADLRVFNDKNISVLKLGKNVEAIADNISLPNLKDITVDDQNANLYSYSHCLYSNDNVLMLVPAKLTSIDIKETTVKIGDSAFKNSALQSVNLPASVTQIGNESFSDCKNLKKIYIPKGTTSIGDSAFEGCTKLRVFDLPSTVTSIGNRAFANCTNLASIILPSKLKSIGDEAFECNISLAGIVIPEMVEVIGNRAFAGCDTLSEIYIWNAELGTDVFADSDKTHIYTILGSNAYAYAREFGIPYTTYTDEDIFYEVCGSRIDVFEGYLGFCNDGHGDIQYLVVSEGDCEFDGYVIGVCEYCSEIIEEKHIAASGHNYYITADIPATETTKGMKVYSCSECGKTYCEYSPATGTDAEIEIHQVTAKVVIAKDRNAQSGVNAASNVDVIIDGMVVATTDSDGIFSISLETGVYTAILHYTFGFDRTIYIRVEDSDINYSSIPIIGCDFNRDGVIDKMDYELFRTVISAGRNDPSYLEYVDMNNDGIINAKDMVIIRNCMELDSSKYEYDTVILQK